MTSQNQNRIDPAVWDEARDVVRRTLRSGLHVAVASTNADGSSHVTPIGSLRLGPEPGTAVWLDVINARLRRNVDHDPRVTILAVDSSRRLWVPAMLKGRFSQSPGLQLTALVGPRRPVTDAERARFERAIGRTASTKGGKAPWSRLDTARDLTFTEVRRLKIGSMTTAVD